jgi:hypothetical protein
MIDESMDTEAMKLPAKEWECRSKPAWQRLIIMLGGIIMNVLVAIVIFSMILFKYGEDKIPMSSLKNGVAFQDSIYNQIGFQNGDKIVSVDGNTITYLDDAVLKILMGKTAEVERSIAQKDVDIEKLKKIEGNLSTYTSYEELDITSQQLLADAMQEYTQEKMVFFIKGAVILYLLYLLYQRVKVGSWIETQAVIGGGVLMFLIAKLYLYFTSKE